MAKTLLQLVGEFDFEATFNQGALLYTPTAYILFITFLITMPLLFTNLLVSCDAAQTVFLSKQVRTKVTGRQRNAQTIEVLGADTLLK